VATAYHGRAASNAQQSRNTNAARHLHRGTLVSTAAPWLIGCTEARSCPGVNLAAAKPRTFRHQSPWVHFTHCSQLTHRRPSHVHSAAWLCHYTGAASDIRSSHIHAVCLPWHGRLRYSHLCPRPPRWTLPQRNSPPSLTSMMDLSPAQNKQNGAPRTHDDPSTGSPNRIAHTLTACCRCRTVSTPEPRRMYLTSAASTAQNSMRPRPPPMRPV
jgi:hypothetical protein